jgi:YD repeat-containing protein
MVRFVLRQSISRSLIRPLIAAQVLLGIPVAAAAPVAAPSPLFPAVVDSPPAQPPQVTVNRTVPKVSPPPPTPVFSEAPTREEIFRARVFPEPVVPVGGEPTTIENRAVANLLTELHRGTPRWRELVARFLMTHRTSPWTPSLLANVATLYARDRNFSRALDAWDEAYQLAKDETSAYGRAVADFALAEWLTLASRFGNGETVMARLKEAERRSVSGTAASNIARVRENLAIIRDNPKEAIACGAEAILALLRLRGMPEPSFLKAYVARPGGTSLLEMRDLASRAGLPVQMVTRDDARVLPTPAIVHLKVGHYVTVTGRSDNRYQVLDRAVGGSYWMSEDVLFQEMSGFALLLDAKPIDGWKPASDVEAARVMGSGPVCPDRAPPPPPPCDSDCPNASGGGSGPGMAIYRFEDVTASLILHDSPIAYSPPRGPAVPLTFSYHHRNVSQPQTFTTANVGPKWSFGWLRFVQEVPTDALGLTPPHVWVMQPPAGREVFSNPDAAGVFPAHWDSRAVLVRVSTAPLKYERRLRDGTVEVYGLSDNAPAGERRVLMTELIDPHQQKLEFTWDAQGRLLAIEDAIGQVTTLSYEHGADPLKITKVTDPFGRFATLTYNAAGQLESITDVIGLISRFTYGPEDFITTLTTPYGTTTFRQEPRNVDIYSHRFIEATDPLGGTEHLSFEYSTPSLPATESANEVPTGFAAYNNDLNKYNTFYWSKRASMLGANDKSKAEITHWMGREEYAGWQVYSYEPHSVKRPLESRVWYAYPG